MAPWRNAGEAAARENHRGGGSRTGGTPRAPAETPRRPSGALRRPEIATEQGLEEVRLMCAGNHNYWGASVLWRGESGALPPSAYPVFSHAIVAGLVAPYSPFLKAVLGHYKIQLLHLRPDAITLLSIFAFGCEAWLGVRPSVAFLRHLFEMRVVGADQCSGCVAFSAAKGAEGHFFPVGRLNTPADFRSRWVWMDAGVPWAALEKPSAPAVRRPEWDSQALPEAFLKPLVSRVAELCRAGLTGQMIAAEFLRERIAPLQEHDHGMWEYSGEFDPMRLRVTSYSREAISTKMASLFGVVLETRVPLGAGPLYRRVAPKRLILLGEMPPLDAWGPPRPEPGPEPEGAGSCAAASPGEEYAAA